MAKKEEAQKGAPGAPVHEDGDAQLTQQAAEQTGGQQVRLQIDERNKSTFYANAFRHNGSADELVLDLGMNRIYPTPRDGAGKIPDGQPAANIIFEINAGVVLNYYTAKRLAITLGQLVRQHEDKFGKLKLNTAERMKSNGS